MKRNAIETALAATLARLPADAPYAVLNDLNKQLGTHGIEAIYQGDDKPSCMYLNTGETYAATVIYDEWQQRYRVQSWGDWLEEQEADGYAFN